MLSAKTLLAERTIYAERRQQDFKNEKGETDWAHNVALFKISYTLGGLEFKANADLREVLYDLCKVLGAKNFVLLYGKTDFRRAFFYLTVRTSRATTC